MLPRNALDTMTVGQRLVPHYLTEHDLPWLSALIEVYDAHVGRTRGELETRMSEPLPVEAPPRALRMARHVLDRRHESTVCACVEPATARLAAAKAMARLGERALAVEAAARECGCAPADLEAALGADVPSLRVIEPPKVSLSAEALRLEVNLALVSGLLRRALGVSIRASGRTRQLVRQAQLRGLIVELVAERGVSPLELSDEARAFDPDGFELRITGPLALFRHTLVYGRALASLVQRLGWCESFELRATCDLGPSAPPFGPGCRAAERPRSELALGPGDPLPWCKEPLPYDSQLERRFSRELRRLAPDWELRREPMPIKVAGSFAFPDFELVHRRDARRRYLLEIAGYYTEEYIRAKLRMLRVATREPLLLCVDTSRSCSRALVPISHPRVLTFERTLRPGAVLERLGIA